MTLFEFELHKVENIEPWGKPDEPRLSLYALSLGTFRIRAGGHVLYRYSPEIRAHWQSEAIDADYQLFGFAREVLSIFAAATARVPPRIERLAAQWTSLRSRRDAYRQAPKKSAYDAWRWFGERTLGTYFLLQDPQVTFIRLGNEIQIGWDNSQEKIESISVWSEPVGVHLMPVEHYEAECRDFSARLLSQMSERIAEIEDGRARPECAVDFASLRAQLLEWTVELDGYFSRAYVPDIPWDRQEEAMRGVTTR